MVRLDRRVERTRKLLQEALLVLIIEQGYDTLRIEDITERANLRRATFYMHYKDKEELLLSALSETFNRLAQETEHFAAADRLGGKTHYGAYLTTFKHAEQNHTLYRNILNSQSGAVFARRIREYLAGLILQGLHQIPDLALPADVVANYIAGAELAMITWWLENDMPYPAEQVAQGVYQLTLRGVADTLNITISPDNRSD